MFDAVPLMSCAEAGEWESRLLPDASSVDGAMERAGAAIAATLREDFRSWRAWPEAPRILILAGKGKNTGDALIAVRKLALERPKLTATILWIFGDGAARDPVLRAADGLREVLGERVFETVWTGETTAFGETKDFEVTIDGIVGMSFQPPWRAPGEAVVRWAAANRSRLGYRVAVDLPSGMGDTSGAVIFTADVTYATGIVKRPLLQAGATRWTGRVRFLDLGFFGTGGSEADPADVVSLPSVVRQIGVPRPAFSDKRDYGHVYVLGGSRRYPGAILMATHAAVRAGAGLITALVPAPLAPALAAVVPEAMWMELPVEGEGSFSDAAFEQIRDGLGKRGVLVVGPGMIADGTNARLVARILREVELPLVLDAGSLGADLARLLADRSPAAGPVVLTPHQGEFNRLLNREGGDYAREDLVRLSRESGATVVLKGPVTRVCRGGTVYHCPVGNPVLARGGSGDLLAGMIGARLSVQPDHALQAALEAVQWHGAAADALSARRGETGVRTTELLDYLSPALRSAWDD